MNRRRLLTIFTASAAIGLATGFGARRALACDAPEFTKAIHFAPGKSSAVIKRTVASARNHEWIAKGKPGQMIQISIEAKKAVFTVTPDTKTEKEPVWGSAIASGSGVKSFVGKLPASGRMLIEVWTEAGKDSYVLGVTLI